MLDRFRDGSKAVLIASHSMSLIRQQCDRVVWLDRGQVRMEGDPESVTAAYLEDSKREQGRLGAA
jgi:ABC-type polysaccharide/polyol phosphate transport system ATPase subunit